MQERDLSLSAELREKLHRHPARRHAHDCIQQPPLLHEGRMAVLKLTPTSSIHNPPFCQEYR